VSARRAVAGELAPATISEADGVRYLHLGTPWVQGAMRLRRSLGLELEYIQRMMVWMLLRPGSELASGQAVQLGLGAGAITRFCHSTLRMRCTAVELNPSVIEACRLWFHLPHDSPRLQVLEMDASEFVADPRRAGTVQVLCVDLYDHDAAAPVLDSAEFYEGCARMLDDGGVMTVNLFGRDASFERSAQRIVAAFGGSGVCSLRPTREGNTVVAAVRGGVLADRDTLALRAQNIEKQYKLPARKWLRMIRPVSHATTVPESEESQP
jgi:spermidine synthase